eukprot:TRINITY_DN10869_c0_g2_i1.p1 TRINITY_DN10869_c0_g2~~TRINITY_DN10869_c0_g2_i1.p1  ORF type:complete len:149 (+),score=43.41 TRINITY_DN10869_c0_g2_i1:71-517(+)
MSEATKRKYVARELDNEFPEPTEDQTIVKVIAPRGNNLHEAEWPTGETHLISMPPKFRKHVWIKRGMFVIAEDIEEGDKVKAEIAFVLQPMQIKHLRQEGLWPAPFDVEDEQTDEQPEDDDEDDPFAGGNPNRRPVYYEEEESSDDEQ